MSRPVAATPSAGDSPDAPGRDTGSWLVAVLVAGLFVWLFADVLTQAHLFVYRDAAHFYYPLFELVESQWAAGRVPLWNPYENCGTPILANPTASVFYPGKLVFLLPIGFDAAYTTYILMHIVLAAGGAYLLARRWAAGVEGAGLAALAYAFGGNVMFQYCNVVFLCGAAWLPVAVLLAATMLEARRPAAAAGLGLVLALMTTGGDPQMAYQAGLLAALYALLLWLEERRQTPDKDAPEEDDEDEPRFGLARHRLSLLAQAAGWALALAAVQVLPTLEFGALSVRGHSDQPRSLYDIPGHLARESAAEPGAAMPRIDTGQPAQWHDTLRGDPPPPAAHYSVIYEFSVGPWRLLEFLWPNVSGRQFPTNRRWIAILPAEAAIWVPSLYVGLLPVVLAAGSWRLLRGDPRLRWLSWMVVLSVGGSFGKFGLGWLLRVTTGWKPVGDEVGGLYWFFVVLLPGYAEFRFPAKLLVIATLAVSLLAALGWSRMTAGEHPGRLLARLGLASAGLLSLVLIGTFLGQLLSTPGWWEALLAGVESDAYFGTLDTAGAWRDLTGGLLHASLVSGALWWLVARSRAAWRWRAMLILTALELGVANRWMVATAPAALWHERPKIAEAIEQAECARGVSDPAQSPPRVYRLSSWNPESWGETSSPARQEEGLVWDRATLFPKYNLHERISLVQTTGTMELYDYELFWQPSMRKAASGDATEIVQPRRAVDAWGARYLILPKTSHPDDTGRSLVGLRESWLEPRWSKDRPQGSPGGPRLPAALSEAGPLAGLEDVELFYNPSHFPRTWIVHEVLAMPPLARHDQRRVQGIMQATLFPFQHWLDLSQMALVEDEAMVEFVAQLTGNSSGQLSYPAPPGESSRIVSEDPQRVEVEAVLESPGLVVLSDVHYPGWTLEVQTLEGENAGPPRPLPVLKTNRMMRGALLPPGRHRLVYRFQPSSFWWGAVLSGLAWLGLLGWGAWRFRAERVRLPR